MKAIPVPGDESNTLRNTEHMTTQNALQHRTHDNTDQRFFNRSSGPSATTLTKRGSYRHAHMHAHAHTLSLSHMHTL